MPRATRSRPLRVVLDTNVVVSALCFTGTVTAQLRRAWQRSAIVPLASQATITELIRVLSYPKFGLTPAEQHDLLADYLPWCETVTMPSSPLVGPVCRDPFDVPFVELAIVGKADALVSGDSHLLELSASVNFALLTPAGLVGRLEQL